jgi:putative DNA primase/helicase
MARTGKSNPSGGVHPRQGSNRRSYEEPYTLGAPEREVLKAALEYAAQGWPVFPCKPDPINKKPLTKKGFKDATTDLQIIEQWWRRWPEAMIGVPMGSASGIFCVDLDRKKPKPGQTFKDGVATWAEYVAREGAVVETRQSETPSTGQHLLFRHRDGIRNVGLDQLGPGLEIKGEGGYIIVPPSRHAEGVYRWSNTAEVAAAPDWLIQKILTKHEPRKVPDWLQEHIRKYAGEGVSTDPQDLPSPPTRERIEAALAAINPDIGRAEWIAIGCALYTQFGEEIGFELWDGWSGKGNKYREREMPGQWRSIAAGNGYNFTIGTLFYHANESNPNWYKEIPKQPQPKTTNGSAGEPQPTPQSIIGVRTVCLADVEAKKIDWLWKGRIARGKLTILAGHPDETKSLLSLDIGSRVTREGEWPCGEGRAPLGNVIVLTAEDDLGDTVRPRMEVAGADLTRVHIVTAVQQTKNQRARSFDLTQDIDQLEEAVQRIGNVVLIIIDPISAYMGRPGKLDSYRSTDVRGVLMPLQEMAARTKTAVIGIDHLSKAGAIKAMMRVLGSIAFTAAPRGVYLVIRDPEDHLRRLFLPVKLNIGKIRTGLAYRVIERLAPPPVFEAHPALQWEDIAVTMTADEALSLKPDGRRSETAEKAKTLILDMLREKPALSRDIEQRAKELQIGEQSLKTAKKTLGVISTRIEGVWWWSLPGQTRPM